MCNPYDLVIYDHRELSSDIQDEIMCIADADYIGEINIEHVNKWLQERKAEWDQANEPR